MPYITQDRRDALEAGAAPADGAITAGDVAYMLTSIVDSVLAKNGLSYANINAMIGALECAKLELYRRIAAPYEDQKLAENGDVYTGTL